MSIGIFLSHCKHQILFFSINCFGSILLNQRSAFLEWPYACLKKQPDRMYNFGQENASHCRKGELFALVFLTFFIHNAETFDSFDYKFIWINCSISTDAKNLLTYFDIFL